MRHISEHLMGSELAAELYVDEVLDGQGRLCYLDTVGSVSASELRWLHYASNVEPYREILPEEGPHGT